MFKSNVFENLVRFQSSLLAWVRLTTLADLRTALTSHGLKDHLSAAVPSSFRCHERYWVCAYSYQSSFALFPLLCLTSSQRLRSATRMSIKSSIRTLSSGTPFFLVDLLNSTVTAYLINWQSGILIQKDLNTSWSLFLVSKAVGKVRFGGNFAVSLLRHPAQSTFRLQVRSDARRDWPKSNHAGFCIHRSAFFLTYRCVVGIVWSSEKVYSCAGRGRNGQSRERRGPWRTFPFVRWFVETPGIWTENVTIFSCPIRDPDHQYVDEWCRSVRPDETIPHSPRSKLRFEGANYSLMKIVFEMNLRLFSGGGASKYTKLVIRTRWLTELFSSSFSAITILALLWRNCQKWLALTWVLTAHAINVTSFSLS